MATEKICEICGEKSKALHMHMKKHNQEIQDTEALENVRQPKEEVVKILMNEIPALFDQFPRGSLSLQGVEKLVDKIIKLL